MKIVVFLENTHCGGVDTFCENLINYWPNQDDYFLFICNKSHPGLINIKNNINRQCHFISHVIPISWAMFSKYPPIFPYRVIRIFRFLIRFFLLPIQFYKIKRLFQTNHGDALLSVSGGYPGGETCRLASIVWGQIGLKGNIYNFHNLAQPPRLGIGWYEAIMDKLLFKYVDSFIGVSKICTDSLRIRPSFKTLNNLQYIYNGVNVTVNNNSLDIHSMFDIPEGAFICLMLGTYEKRKGHEFIFKVFEHASKNAPDMHLVICGGGEEDEVREVEVLKHKLAPGRNVHLSEFIPNGAQLIGQSNILLIGSQEMESFGLTAIEAMQQGVPIVSTNIGGLPEVIGNDGECGFLTERDDVAKFSKNINELYTNKILYKEMASRAKLRFLDKFTPDKMAQQYMDRIIMLNDNKDK
jgi:L-malate glycosyltransferase